MEPLDADIQAAVDQFVLDQLDFVLHCEWQPNCYYLATWIGVFPCCQASWNVCNNHQQEADEIVAEDDNIHIQCGGDVKKMAWLKI